MCHSSNKADCVLEQLQDCVAEEGVTFEHFTLQITEVTSGSDIDGGDNESCKVAVSMHACLMSSVVPPAYKHEDMNPTEFYQKIYLNCDPGDNPKEINIYVRHKPRLQKWKYSIKSGVCTTNSHAPGLKLKITEEKLTSDIIIRPVDVNCYTEGNILADSKSHVNLPTDFNKDYHMESIVLPEFLHALGFQHEHQRRDGRQYIIYGDMSRQEGRRMDKALNRTKGNFVPITAYDPYSIMHYPVFPDSKMKRHGEGPFEGVQNITLTELDKIGLNIVYPPARSPAYNPKKNAKIVECNTAADNLKLGLLQSTS